MNMYYKCVPWYNDLDDCALAGLIASWYRFCQNIGLHFPQVRTFPPAFA